jgi:hypothetical protein
MRDQPCITDDAFAALGFARADDGTLIAPPGSVVTLAPVGAFFELRISLASTGNCVTAVLAKVAIKVGRGRAGAA